MLNKGYVLKKFSIEDCREARGRLDTDATLTQTRLERLKATQAKNPEWAAYDKYADDIVGIDIRIEEQYAVREDIEDDLKMIDEREDILIYGSPYRESPRPGKHTLQLSFFDSVQKRERLGVPC